MNTSKEKSYWNYRVLVFEYGSEITFQLCEVYYDNDKPTSYTDENKPTSDDGIKGLKWLIEIYKEAIKKPILFGGEKFPKEFKHEKKVDKR